MASFIDDINAYENGELGEDETVALFQDLLDRGIVWKLQGSYQRTAVDLLTAGLIRRKGWARPGMASSRRFEPL